MSQSKLTYEVIEKIIQKRLEVYKVDPDTKLMRYMDLAKFLDLIECESLFLTRADRFEDQLEGSVHESYLRKRFFKSLLFSEEFVENNKQEHIKWVDSLKSKTFISCWNIAEEESYALWKVYAKEHGVAILTSKYKLDELIEGTEAQVCKVHYVDEDDDVIYPRINENDLSKPYFMDSNFFATKSKFYEYEQEVRIISMGSNEKYKRIQINNLESFIEKVYISPFSEEWVYHLIKKILKDRYMLNLDVISSRIKLNKD